MRFLSSLLTLGPEHGKGVGGTCVGDSEECVSKGWGHFHLHPLFLFKTKGPRAPESGGFVSVLLGIFLPPSCGIEESTSSKTFSPFPCGDSLNRHCALWLSDSLPRNLNFLGDLLLWKGKGQSPP